MKGQSGPDVEAWQHFLLGIDPTCDLVVDGLFGDAVSDQTMKFQRQTGIDADGKVGPSTLGRAMLLGFNPLTDVSVDLDGPNWPPAPSALPNLSNDSMEALFGKFAYVAAPQPGNPEAIKITDNWAATNIVSVPTPQLKIVSSVAFHKSCVTQLQKLLQDWDDAGLTSLILTWGGSWAPRYIRGSRSVLSNHAWGTAFDINVQWNMLGSQPALKGQKGSVRELVDIAYQNGFGWGGWFPGRPDGMHFQVFEIRP